MLYFKLIFFNSNLHNRYLISQINYLWARIKLLAKVNFNKEKF
jgi:hypothetical protein